MRRVASRVTGRPGRAHHVRVPPVPFQRPRTPLQAAFFMVPVVVVCWALGSNDAIAPAVCLATGAAWQLVFRRDLADRLMRICAWAAVAIVGALVLQLSIDSRVFSDAPGGFTAIVGLLSGLVLTEHGFRHREERRPVAAAEDTVPARP